MKEQRNSPQVTKVKLVKPKLLKDVIIDLEEKMGMSLRNLIKEGKVTVLINGKTTMDLMSEVKSGDEIIALPVLRGG